MNKYYITYFITVEAEDIDEAGIIADEIECNISGLKYVKSVGSDSYIETEQ